MATYSYLGVLTIFSFFLKETNSFVEQCLNPKYCIFNGELFLWNKWTGFAVSTTVLVFINTLWKASLKLFPLITVLVVCYKSTGIHIYLMDIVNEHLLPLITVLVVCYDSTGIHKHLMDSSWTAITPHICIYGLL